jgi:cell division protein FtsW
MALRRRNSWSKGGSLPKKRIVSKIDFQLLLCVGMLLVFGLIMVYDAAVVQAFKDTGDKYYYIKQQLIWMGLGIVTLVSFTFFNYQFLRKLALPMLLGSLLLLLAVFIPGLGYSAGGAHRWLNLGPINIQPAEIIKLTSIIFFASLFERRVRTFPFFSVVFVVSFIIGVLQRDLGSTIVFFLTSVFIYYFAGAPLKYILSLVPIGVIGFLAFVLSAEYRKNRVLAFLDPFADPQGYSYHISQVLIAIGSGGFFGLGIGQSRQKFEYIPEVTTDSIFAVVGEELGFAGSMLLISLFVFLVYKGFKITQNCEEPFGKLLAFGLTSWLGLQTIINLGAMVSIFPLTGVPLPFISYGGSALLANLMAVGILLNISKANKSG